MRKGTVRAPARLRRRSWPSVWGSGALFALALTSLAPSLYAQTDPADARFETGRALRRARRDAEALAHFEAMYAETHQARALAQVALAEAALSRWTLAEEHLAQALAHPDAWVTANLATGANLQSQAALIAGHLGGLEVVCPTAGAALWVAGRSVATLPQARALRVEPGPVAFEVRAAGFVTATRTVAVAATQVAREVVTLVPSTPAVTSGPVAPRLPVAPAPAASNPLRTAAWVAAGGAAALLIGGAVAYAVAAPSADRWNDDQQCLRPGLTREQVCHDDGAAAQTMGTLATVGFVGGAALVGAGVLLFVVSARPAGAPTRTAFRCDLGLSAPSVTCGGVF